MALRSAEDPRTTASFDDVVQRRALAIVQHQRVLEEAAEVARLSGQARNRAAAAPVFADVTAHDRSVRDRINWERAS